MSGKENTYGQDHVGSPDGRFESASRIYVEPSKILVPVVAAGGSGTDYLLDALVTKPDPRLLLRVSIGFQTLNGADDADVTANLPTVATWWVAGLGDIGGELRPVEDVEGTGTLFVPIVLAQELYGRVIEVDSDFEAIQLKGILGSPGRAGYWRLRCAWCARYPMSERDWQVARASMKSEFKAGEALAL